MNARPTCSAVHRRRRAWWLAAGAGLSAALAVNACAGDRPEPPRHPRKSLLSSVEVTPAYPSPATWRYHPQKAAPLRVHRELPGGRVLYAGDHGERWLVDTRARSVRAAAWLAPEDLVAILKLDSGGWLFVGGSGTTYEAEQPLGPFVRSSAPLDPLARVTAAASTLLGVRRDGTLVQSGDAGASWHVVGPAHTRFADVALDKKGRGLALAVPEQLYATRDRGATWKRLDQKTFGALSVQRRAGDRITVASVSGLREWKPGAPSAFAPLSSRSRSSQSAKLPFPPPRGPDAGTLFDGRAVVVGTRYFEVVQGKTGGSWRLLSGPVDGLLREQSFVDAQGCRAVRIAGFGRWLYVACSRSSSGRSSRPIELLSSRDSGRHWKREGYRAVGDISGIRIAVGRGGALLVTGICPPHAAGNGCGVQGVYYRRRAVQDAGAAARSSEASTRQERRGKRAQVAAGYDLAPAATPALKGSASALVFSIDGRTAYAIGRRTKDGAFAVYVSHNGGRSFEAHEIKQLAADYERNNYGRYSYRPPGYRQRGTDVESVMAAGDGTLAIVLSRNGKTTLLVTDEQGRVLSIAHAPSARAAIGAAGTRALAVAPGSGDAWESLDGGATWDPIGGLPFALCGVRRHCTVPVYCYPGGCVLGDVLSRIGWRGQADRDEGVLAPPAPAPLDLYDRDLHEPISCTLDAAAWKTLDGLRKAPDAARAELGRAVWFSPASDDDRASAWMYQATGGSHPRVEKVTLLAPARRPRAVALRMIAQVEGGAAVRYEIPDGVHSTRLRNVEVAWDNLFEGRVVHAHIADGGPYVPGDYKHGSGRAQLANPALLSIASGGIYLRLHGGLHDAQPTLFLDGRSQHSVPPVSWPSLSLPIRSEMVHIGRAHLPILLIGRGAALMRAVLSAGSYRFDAMTTGLPRPQDFGLRQTIGVTYLKGHAGLVVKLQGRRSGQHRSQLFLFRDGGAVLAPPIAVPTQEDVPDRPARCSTTQRTSTPRVIQNAAAGTQHPVIVSDANEPLRGLLTQGAVMYGTPSSPCVAAYGAAGVKLQGGAAPQHERAILPLDDLDHSWLFRGVPSPGGRRVQYRNMKCRFDSGAEVPPELYRAAVGYSR